MDVSARQVQLAFWQSSRRQEHPSNDNFVSSCLHKFEMQLFQLFNISNQSSLQGCVSHSCMLWWCSPCRTLALDDLGIFVPWFFLLLLANLCCIMAWINVPFPMIVPCTSIVRLVHPTLSKWGHVRRTNKVGTSMGKLLVHHFSLKKGLCENVQGY